MDEFSEYRNMSLPALAQTMTVLKDRLQAAEAETSAIRKEFDYLRLVVVPEAMEELGVTSMNVKGIGRLTVTADLDVTVKAEDRESVYDWLSEHGHRDLIVNYVWPQTMKAFVKEAMRNGEELTDLISIRPFTRASVTRT